MKEIERLLVWLLWCLGRHFTRVWEYMGKMSTRMEERRAHGSDRLRRTVCSAAGRAETIGCGCGVRSIPAGAITAFIGGAHLIWLVRRGGTR